MTPLVETSIHSRVQGRADSAVRVGVLRAVEVRRVLLFSTETNPSIRHL